MRLVLFFTAGVSLTAWDEAGMFPREVALYQALQKCGVQVDFVTYGGPADQAFRDRLPGIGVHCNHRRLPRGVYSRWIHRLHAGVIRGADVLKTNQTKGGEVVLRAARLAHKPFIARCGYMLSTFEAMRWGDDSALARRSRGLEEALFTAAASVVVTTDEMRADIVGRVPAVTGAISVIPNYVDTELFFPDDAVERAPDKLCFVGQLKQRQKNPLALVEAVKGLDVDVDLIGEGQTRDALEQAALENPRIRLWGRVANDRLPEHLRRCTAFVLPSFYEGHPKTLIEAMACGCPVIAANVPGIRNVIVHGETGWLCEPDAPSLRNAIEYVVRDESLRRRLGRSAGEYARKHYALDTIVNREIALYEDVVRDKGTA